MSKMTIVKTNAPMPAEKDLAAVRHFLFGCFDGFLDADRKAWKGFWKRFIKLGPGEMAQAEIVIPRNYKFHKKFMALMNFAFDAWEPDRSRKTYKGRPITKNFDRFRKDIVIQAGFYEQTFDLDGRMRLEAQSISFANMDEAQFEAVYSACVDVVLQKVLITYKDREELDRIMDQIVGFM